MQRLNVTVPQSLGWQMKKIIVSMSSMVLGGLTDNAFKELGSESGTR